MPDRSFLYWPFFEDSHRQLAGDVEAWAARELGPYENVPREETDGACRRLVSLLADGGWLRWCVPPSDGGSLDVRALCLIRETLARHAGLADFAFVMQGLGSGPISLFGSRAQREQFLPAAANGEHIMAFALSEPEAGSDVAAISTAARRDGGDYLLDGVKTWISNGGIAGVY